MIDALIDWIAKRSRLVAALRMENALLCQEKEALEIMYETIRKEPAR